MPSARAILYFLLAWTIVSIPLAFLVGAMIKFGADGKLPFGRKLRARSREARRIPAVAEKRVARSDAA